MWRAIAPSAGTSAVTVPPLTATVVPPHAPAEIPPPAPPEITSQYRPSGSPTGTVAAASASEGFTSSSARPSRSKP